MANQQQPSEQVEPITLLSFREVMSGTYDIRPGSGGKTTTAQLVCYSGPNVVWHSEQRVVFFKGGLTSTHRFDLPRQVSPDVLVTLFGVEMTTSDNITFDDRDTGTTITLCTGRSSVFVNKTVYYH